MARTNGRWFRGVHFDNCQLDTSQIRQRLHFASTPQAGAVQKSWQNHWDGLSASRHCWCFQDWCLGQNHSLPAALGLRWSLRWLMCVRLAVEVWGGTIILGKGTVMCGWALMVYQLNGISHSDSGLYTWGTNKSLLCYWSHFSGIKTCVCSSSCRCRWSTNCPHCSRHVRLVFAASVWTLLYIHWVHTSLSEIVTTWYSMWQRRSRSLWCISAGIWCQSGKSILDWLNYDTRFHALICLLKCLNHRDGVPGTVCSQARSRWTMRCIACGKL